MNALTFFVEMTVEQLFDLHEAIKENGKNDPPLEKDAYRCVWERKGRKKIVIDKDAVCGLYDTWSGAGSVLEINLEKDVVLPLKYVSSALPDGGRGWSVANVYGVCSSMWTPTLKKILEGFNDLASVCPDVAEEWSDRNLPLTPNMVTAFSNKKVWWKCKLGHEWNALISTRSYGSKCPYCCGIELLKGFNDLATTQPELSKEWSARNHPLSPDQINDKSRLNVWWKCHTCGYEWKAVVFSRVHGSKCPVCTERSVMPGYNDLATTDPELIAEWDFEKNIISPSRVSRFSMYSYWWKCRYGHSCIK